MLTIPPRSAAIATAVLATAATLAAVTGSSTSAAPEAVRPRCEQPGSYQLPHGSEHVRLNPDDFTTRIDNPYWPMAPGTRWTYIESAPREDDQRIEVTVTHRTRVIRGVTARVVHDVATEHGQLIENTFDWYAQDDGGSIWYLGEFTREYEDGEVVSTEGSWEYGVDGAQAGVLVPARPVPGCGYRQEHRSRVAEDRGLVLTTRDDVSVHGSRYRDALVTSDRTPLEPFVLEHKFYAQDVGPVEAVEVSPGAAREVLVSLVRPGR